MAQTTIIFAKSLTVTDIKKRLAIPTKSLSSLPDFNVGSHNVEIHLWYRTKMWPIVCSIRRRGRYKKPVFSGGWRNFVICNNFNVGDKLTLYKVQDGAESFYYSVEVEKPARRPSGDLSDPPPARSLNHDDHEVDETPGTSRTKVCSNYEVNVEEQLPKADADAPIKLEGVIMEHSEACYQSTNTDMVSLDLVLGESNTPYTGSLNLNLTLAPPIVDGGLEEEPVFSQ